MKAKIPTITNEQAKILMDLIQLDIEAVEAYRQALAQINKSTIADTLLKCCEEHEIHIQELSAILLAERYEPPVITQDFKALLIKGTIVMSGLMGNSGVLKSIQANEELIHKKYSEANEHSFPEYITIALTKILNEETCHLNEINQMLK